MTDAPEPADISTAVMERRYANISALLALLKYQQQILLALAGVMLVLFAVPVQIIFLVDATLGVVNGSASISMRPAFMPFSDPRLVLALTIASLIGMVVLVRFVRASVGVPIALALFTPLIGILGLCWLALERLVSRVGMWGGIVGLVLTFFFLIFTIVGTLRGIDGLAEAAGYVGETSVAAGIGIALVNAPLLLVPLVAGWAIARAAVTILRLSPRERALMRDTQKGFSPAGVLLTRMWGMPPTYSYARRPRARFAGIMALSVLAALFLSLAGVFVLGGPGAVIRTFDGVVGSCGYHGSYSPDEAAACIYRRVGAFLAAPVVLIAFAALLVALGAACQRAARRLVRFSLADLQSVDPRPPVLFLRAFADDQVQLRPSKAPWIVRMLEAGRRRTSLDQMLLDEATAHGPVVGIGKPGDRRPPYGAARGYFDDRTWQEAVSDLASHSAAIVMCLDDTDGIWWEVEHLVASAHLNKALFLIHPKHADADANLRILEKFSQFILLNPDESGRLLAVPLQPKKKKQRPETVIGFFVDQRDQLQVVRSPTHAHLAYLLTVRLFLRERLALAVQPLPADVQA